MKRALIVAGVLTFTMACAGLSRECASFTAVQVGADWIVVQFNMTGHPFNCWRLSRTSITNESGSDGIYWQDPDGHLVHISGWYNRVQVAHTDWTGAAKTLGIDLGRCVGGQYRE